MYIDCTNSTNTLMKELLARGEWPEGERWLRTDFQSAGRGQAGNSWESAPGKNLLCSILLGHHRVKDKNPFYLNVLISVAVHKVIRSVLCQRSGLCSVSEAVSIKWPNDIYWQDKKVAGLLVETALQGGEIKYAIAGIGLNVNQTEWFSDAPNPISLQQITGKQYDLDALMQQLLEQVDETLGEDMWHYYTSHLYRREGFWPFVEREVNTAPTMNVQRDDVQCTKAFMARIEDILPSGEIVLRDQQNQERIYHFKQIRYVV